MTTTQELLKSSFELNLNNYGPEDVERLNDWAIKAYAALEAAQAEVVRLRVIAKEASEYATKHQTEVLRLQAQLAAAQGQLVIPSDVREMAEKIQKNVYRAPLSWAAKVIDFVADYAAPIPQPPAPSEAAREYMTGYSDGREWAKPSQALVVELVYQYQLANGNWIDQTKESYDYNVKHGQATVRMLYATPQAAPLYAKEQQ